MKKLVISFYGRGEARGFIFRQIERTEKGYVYVVTQPYINNPHYEVFKHRENQRFGVVSYPSGEAFGHWAWTFPTLQQAREKLAEITLGESCPNLPHVMEVFALEIDK